MRASNIARAAIAGALLARFVWKRLRRRSVKNASVVITGGSRGLGLELARAFGERGARVAIAARKKEELERALDDLRFRGIEAYAFVCDLTDRVATDECIAAASKRLGGIDMLINNAGRIEVGPYETMTEEDFHNELQLHLYAPLWAIQAALPSLRERHGRIVNIASIGGLVSVPHLLPYSVSKFALVGLSEGLRAELVRQGVSVITVCPGLMRTGSAENADFKSQNQKEYAWFAASDATGITSISARSAALRILSAVENCEPFVVVSAQAKVLAFLHAVFPNATALALSLTAAILPKPGGIGSARATGRESHSRLLPAFLLTSLERTAKEQNQLV